MNRSIIFIIPPTKYSRFMKYEQYLHTPLEGITVLVNILSNKSFDVRILDCRDKVNPIEWILSNSFSGKTIFGITTFFDSFKFVLEITESIKRYYPKSVIILGGPLATFAYETFLNYTSSDFVILGEAEISFPFLIDTLYNNSSAFPAGIAYKRSGNICTTVASHILENLDAIPDLDWAIYPNLQEKKFSFTYLLSRGCNKKCSYCNPIFKKMRAKSSQKVRIELLNLKGNYGMNSILLNDLDFLHIERVENYCKIFKELEIKWGCFARPEKLNSQLLRFVQEHGCVNIRFGVESFDQQVLDMNYRYIKVDDMEEVILMATDSGIQKITCYFIIGLPGETESTLEKTTRKVEQFSNIIPRPFYLIPLPGTKVYHDALKKGLIDNESRYLTSLEKVKLEADDTIHINLSQVPISKLEETFNILAKIATSREQNLSCPITV
jgi:anaerobic magnesium-protoporphyrin IX monomethyl ester cyclase